MEPRSRHRRPPPDEPLAVGGVHADRRQLRAHPLQPLGPPPARSAGRPAGQSPYGNFDWASEKPDAAILPAVDVFPEPRIAEPGSNVNGLRINHSFPWQIHPYGSEEETLNHIGRHELHNYFTQSFNDDPNLIEFIDDNSGRTNPNPILNFFQIAEDPEADGTYYGVDAPEFDTHASGQIVRLTAPPTLPADEIVVDYVTHPDTGTVVDDGETPPATHSGHYREPLPLEGGGLLSVHTAETRDAHNEGTRAHPDPRYDFRIKDLVLAGGYYEADSTLLPGAGVVREIQYWDTDVLVSYNGPMWELSPVEVRPRPAPPVLSTPLPAPEAQIFAEEGVSPEVFRDYLAERDLALVVSRDVTTRDVADRQQPFNLRVPGGAETVVTGGIVYDVRYLQFFQGDQIRGIGGYEDPRPGRREPVVRERYWLTFQPGEVRVCASCHGLNSVDQAGRPAPTNPPEALRQLLRYWQNESLEAIFNDGFESGDTSAWSFGG